jgi:hypothetical protein
VSKLSPFTYASVIATHAFPFTLWSCAASLVAITRAGWLFPSPRHALDEMKWLFRKLSGLLKSN